MILDQHGNPMGSKPYIVPATPKQVAEWGYGYEYAYGGSYRSRQRFANM